MLPPTDNISLPTGVGMSFGFAMGVFIILVSKEV